MKRPEVFAWHVTTGTVTRDEARALVFDFAPLPDGSGAVPLDPQSAPHDPQSA